MSIEDAEDLKRIKNILDECSENIITESYTSAMYFLGSATILILNIIERKERNE